jgi:hypothetical protein
MAPRIIHSDGTIQPGTVVASGQAGIDLPACDITFVRVDHQLRFQLEDLEVVVGGAFRLEVDGERWDLDPGDRSGLGPVLALYPDSLAVAVDEHDTLTLRFVGGAVLRVPPHPQYEAWELRGPGRRLVVGNPGGELTVFD